MVLGANAAALCLNISTSAQYVSKPTPSFRVYRTSISLAYQHALTEHNPGAGGSCIELVLN
ncbi:MAG: hypothetical protein ACRENK_14970 [Gemmatimonadaceae bacterium]